ncbi:MAG: hypothetical protein IJ306_10395 [Oscillospiraceae bacterium]|nr:hypothetical protein [Oscillospiraceae bacterium]
MPLGIYDSIVPKGDFAVTAAKYIAMENGKSVEEAFAEASENSAGKLVGNTESVTPKEVASAITKEKTVRISHADGTYGVVVFSNFAYAINAYLVVSSVNFEYGGILFSASLTGNTETDTWSFAAVELVQKTEIPVFDLGAMGMTAIPATGGTGELETDTSELWTALDNGAVTFGIPFEADESSTMTGYCTMHSFTDRESMHQCVGNILLDKQYVVAVMVFPDGIQAAIAPLSMVLGIPEATSEDEGKIMKVSGGVWTAAEATASGEKAVTAVDLSGYESDGIIVETYEDGSTLTHTFEFNEDGKPTKITDSNGNGTVLTW